MAFVSCEEIPFALEMPGSVEEVTRLLRSLIAGDDPTIDVIHPEQGAIVVNVSVPAAFMVTNQRVAHYKVAWALPWPHTVSPTAVN